METLWRIEQLTDLAAQALDLLDYEGQDSGRVREVPDVRTVRYYTTIGLLDRPQEMRGRTAFYGRRHLLQLIAVKRLQSQSKSLVEIQQTLTGANNRKLAKIGAVPSDFWESKLFREPAVEKPRPTSSTNRPSESFWAQTPKISASATPPAAPVTPLPAVILPIDAGVTLVLEGEAISQLPDAWLSFVQPGVELIRKGLEQARTNCNRPNREQEK